MAVVAATRVTLRAAVAAGVVCCALAVSPAAFGASHAPRIVRLTATPGLVPAYSPGIHDYVVRCDPATPVRLALSVAAGTTGEIDGEPVRSATVRLTSGKEVVVTGRAAAGTAAYHIRCLPPDFPSWSVTGSGTPGEWYVATPSLSFAGASSNYVAIFDSDGVPVWWWRDAAGPSINATVLPGDREIAFATWNVPAGSFEVRRFDGTLVRRITSPDGAINVHELQIASNGDEVFLVDAPKAGVDLTPFGGPPAATVIEEEIEEITPAGKLAWSWSTDGNVGLAESTRWLGTILGTPVQLSGGGLGYDFFHANAVSLAGDTVLLSLRQTDGVYAIDRMTGQILWKLGGTPTPESLTVVGDPYGDVPLGGQHDIRILPDGTITVFDDGTFLGRPPRAVHYRIDLANHTATFLGQITDPTVTSSTCCGSARLLGDGDWVISWGGDPTFGEYRPDGTETFRIDFDGLFSYRVQPVAPDRITAAALRAGMNTMTSQIPGVEP